MFQLRRRHGSTALTLLWFGGGTVLLAGIIVTIQREAYGELSQDVFQWFLPHVLPTVGVITSALVATAKKRDRERASALLILLAMLCSMGYLVAIGHALVAELNLARAWRNGHLSAEATELFFLPKASWWLAPMQGVVDTFIVYFFVRDDEKIDS